jgi:hypothetical protein
MDGPGCVKKKLSDGENKHLQCASDSIRGLIIDASSPTPYLYPPTHQKQHLHLRVRIHTGHQRSGIITGDVSSEKQELKRELTKIVRRLTMTEILGGCAPDKSLMANTDYLCYHRTDIRSPQLVNDVFGFDLPPPPRDLLSCYSCCRLSHRLHNLHRRERGHCLPVCSYPGSLRTKICELVHWKL